MESVTLLKVREEIKNSRKLTSSSIVPRKTKKKVKVEPAPIPKDASLDNRIRFQEFQFCADGIGLSRKQEQEKAALTVRWDKTSKELSKNEVSDDLAQWLKVLSLTQMLALAKCVGVSAEKTSKFKKMRVSHAGLARMQLGNAIRTALKKNKKK